ncbi:NAP1-related protein 1 isoform X3 [Dendrobium catenatum]|uniref:NAP1-related protein 1 isoform X3 n=1 Tax=Dendrobium catenatum TaxID=906689 RepID=UPI0009F3BB28|nr:NAP1-related protein 1 isoform X3 [Dendrobium catenatum]
MADDGNSENDDEELVESMGKLQEMQSELEMIDEEERIKIMKVKRKYNEFRRGLYDRRNHIIQSISGFWVSAFLNHPAIAGKLSEEDEKIFKYMVSLEVEDFNDEDSGYSITFNFLPNPFFEGTKLTRAYFMPDDRTTNVTSTKIIWKDGKESKGVKRRITDRSFFKWFDEEPRILTNGVIDEMARVISEELWTDPLKYLKNEADVDVNGDGIDDDNDHDDKEDDDKNFNGSDGNDADNNHNDEWGFTNDSQLPCTI